MSDTTPTRCHVTGYLVVDGVKVRALRCQLDADHGRLHAVTFEWDDDAELAADWPEAYDPDEPVDVDVPELEADALAAIVDAQVDAHREASAFGDE